MIFKPQNVSERNVFLLLASLFILRMVSLFILPLNEVTEARYAEIARKMLETGNWVTPLHDYGVPFLAKPPLWSWLSAASMGVFGVNEFAARFPHFLLAIGTIALIACLARARSGRDAGVTATLVLASCGGFFMGGAAVMTDSALVFCTTLIMVSFWHAIQGHTKVWGWLFFAGAGLGLLAKGPVALIIPAIPLFFWILRRKEWLRLWRHFPWIGGTLLTCAIALPWYALAEIRTPGFLNYFIIGEHFGRFVDEGWSGDRYGYAHAHPFGTIWLFILAGLLPWSLWLPSLAKKIKSVWRDDDGWMLYVTLWSFGSLAVFTLCANIIWPYCLAALPGFALLFAEVFARTGKKRPLLPALLLIAAGSAMLAGNSFFPKKFVRSEKDMIALWQAQNATPGSKLLFWGRRQAFSPAFYSSGRAEAIIPNDVTTLLRNTTQDYIVLPAKKMDDLPPDIRASFSEIGRSTNRRGERILLREMTLSQ